VLARLSYEGGSGPHLDAPILRRTADDICHDLGVDDEQRLH